MPWENLCIFPPPTGAWSVHTSRISKCVMTIALGVVLQQVIIIIIRLYVMLISTIISKFPMFQGYETILQSFENIQGASVSACIQLKVPFYKSSLELCCCNIQGLIPQKTTLHSSLHLGGGHLLKLANYQLVEFLVLNLGIYITIHNTYNILQPKKQNKSNAPKTRLLSWDWKFVSLNN